MGNILEFKGSEIMKEMIYKNDFTREVLDTGFCYGYLYYILNLGMHPTAYIKIPETHWAYNSKSYDDIPINVHGRINIYARPINY